MTFNINVVRTTFDGMTNEPKGCKTYELGAVSPRSLVKAVKMSTETSGFEGYGAPLWEHQIQVGGKTIYDSGCLGELSLEIEDLLKAVRNPWMLKAKDNDGYWLERIGGKSVVGLAQAVLSSLEINARSA